MKNPDIKKEFFPYDHTDLAALEQRLSKRASEGWMITSLRGMLTYTRCAPQKLRFNADILPMADKNTNIINEESRAYINFCEEAGWHFVSNVGIVYVFCTEDASLPDINTDAKEKVKLISKSCRWNITWMWITTGIMLLNLGLQATRMFFPQDKASISIGVLTGLGCFCLSAVLIAAIIKTVSYKKWKKAADCALAAGRPVPYNSMETLEKRRKWLILFMIIMFILMLTPLGFAAANGNKEGLIGAAMAIFFGTAIALFAIHVSRKDLTVGKQVLYILLFMIGAGILSVVSVVVIGTLIGVIS